MRIRILFIGAITAFALAAAPRYSITNFHNYPNPFKASDTQTTFIFGMTSPTVYQKAALYIYSPQGRLLYTANPVTNTSVNPYRFDWRGVDDKGAYVTPGLYHAKVEVRTTEGDIVTASTKVVVK